MSTMARLSNPGIGWAFDPGLKPCYVMYLCFLLLCSIDEANAVKSLDSGLRRPRFAATKVQSQKQTFAAHWPTGPPQRRSSSSCITELALG
ncbi:hypothetical protein BKA80DRAFT_273601 [Phyllosticta citrichinensis]